MTYGHICRLGVPGRSKGCSQVLEGRSPGDHLYVSSDNNKGTRRAAGMGITGLIPFLEQASKRGNISQFAGGTVAIDSYCWLHKGAFSCADKIAMGQPTDAYIKFCMKLVHMLIANRIKPILVFDGRHLPAKKETEVKRRENRESTRRRAAELMRMGQTNEGRNLLRRSVDITHEMALQLIKQCQEENVDCIVAPYEADAQLAYLNMNGFADVVITEDSDLTLFGCKKIFFKMDINGNGILVEQDRIHLAMKIRADHFDIEKFRHMCILSGCDYLASLPGIGLQKACKFVLRNTDGDIHKALGRIGSYLNMKHLTVTNEYRDAFIRALVTFKHQLVYCPLRRKQVRLHPVTPEVTVEQLHYAGDEIAEDKAWQLALGNYDPFTMKQLHDFDPDRPLKRKGKTNSWHQKPDTACVSIWSKDYKVREEKENEKTNEITKWPDTAGQIVVLNTDAMKKKTTTPKKRNFEELAEELSAKDVLELYGSKKLQKNDETADGRSTPPSHLHSSPSRGDYEEITSPTLLRRSNPFARPANTEVSPSLVCRGKRRIKLKNLVGFRPTVIDDRVVQKSKYFNSDSTIDEPDKKEENIATECPRIIELSKRDKPEVFVTRKVEDVIENVIIPETPSSDEASSSSGIFSSQTSSEQDCDIDLSLERKSNIILPTIVTERQPRKNDSNLTDLDRLLDTKCDLASSEWDSDAKVSARDMEEDDESEYSFSKDNIESLRCNLFKWANPKLTAKTSVKSTPPKQKPITAKTRTTRKTLSRKKPAAAESQQSLLKTFGFQKKTVLKN